MKWGVSNIIVSLRLCHPFCKVCFGDNKDKCTVCNSVIEQTKLSFQTCEKSCLIGFGDNTADPTVCIDCLDPNCRYCIDSPTNCRVCNSSYFLYESAPGIIQCVLNCPSTYYKNSTANATCFLCDTNCLTCVNNPTNCLSCKTATYLYQAVCYTECPD